MALTVKRIAKATKPGRYGDGHGLYLQVLSPTNRSWLFRYQRGLNSDGKPNEKWLGLGPLHTVPLDTVTLPNGEKLIGARDKARLARAQLLDGIDPLEAKREERARQTREAARTVTFKQVAEQFYAAHADEWNNAKHRSQFVSTMATYVHPVIGKLPVAAVDEPLVLKVLQPIWQTKNVTARRVRNRIAAVLDYAKAAGYRQGDNAARWEGHLEHLLAKPEKIARVKHLGALPYGEVAAFLTELRAKPGVPARALEFAILCASRTGEIVGMRWDEVDLEQRLWTVPASRMKAGREHRVPLSNRAIEILKTIPRESQFVFVGARPNMSISVVGMYRVLGRMNWLGITVHGFRSAFRDWCGECTNYPREIAEAALAHSIGNKTEQAYRRGDALMKRRKLMEQWARFCSTPASRGAVVPLRGRTR